MKRLEISRLMDEYVDTEFFPTGGSVADPEKVKGWVLTNVKAPAKKKQTQRKKKVLLAAALAAMMAILVGAGFPQRVYQLLNGTLSFTEEAEGRTIAFETQGDPIKLENGRLFLIEGDMSTDITGLISETKPYIIDNSRPDEDMINYRIVGGTPEHYGWFEWITVPNPFASDEMNPMVYKDGRVHTYNFGFIAVQDGAYYPVGGMGTCDPDWRMFSDFNEDAGIDIDDFQWLRIAAEELGIPFTDTTGEIKTTIHG